MRSKSARCRNNDCRVSFRQGWGGEELAVTCDSAARYRIEALGSRLELYLQLNVYRLVVVYLIPAQGTLDSAALQPHFARWAIGATDAGWNTPAGIT